jgi:hypothetical protein
MPILGGVLPPREMVCCVLVFCRQWVPSFGTERKLCPAPTMASNIDTLLTGFLPEGVVVVI